MIFLFSGINIQEMEHDQNEDDTDSSTEENNARWPRLFGANDPTDEIHSKNAFEPRNEFEKNSQSNEKHDHESDEKLEKELEKQTIDDNEKVEQQK